MKLKKYYSIRVVKARDYSEAVKKVQENDFDEKDELCDKIADREGLIIALQQRKE